MYRARVARPPVSDRALRALREGLELDDGRIAPATVRRVRPDELEITIREGRKRQVRRICGAVGHPVLALRRVAFDPLRLEGLPAGAHRRMSRAEVERLRAASAALARAAGAAARAAKPRARCRASAGPERG